MSAKAGLVSDFYNVFSLTILSKKIPLQHCLPKQNQHISLHVFYKSDFITVNSIITNINFLYGCPICVNKHEYYLWRLPRIPKTNAVISKERKHHEK